MHKNTLDKLFGSRIRVKILKFLFRNYPTETLATETWLKHGSLSAKAQKSFPRGTFNAHELSRKIQEPFDSTKNELNILSKIGLVHKLK